MKLKARILAASLAAAIAVSMAGCGSSAASSESASAAASSEAATESIATTGESEVGTYPIVSDPITVKGLVVGRSTNCLLYTSRCV